MNTAARGVTVLALLAVLGAGCSGDGAEDTTTSATAATTTSSSTSTTTTTDPNTLVELEPNGEAFVNEGDAGAYVFALQSYLVCNGLGTVWEGGPSVTVDGVFGPITTTAVATAQAQRRRIPTGIPDEWLFAHLARSCDEERPVVFPDGANAIGLAGNVGSGDEEVFVLAGREGQSLSIFVAEGEVGYTVDGVDGTAVKSADEPGNWVGELPTSQNYRIRVTSEAGDTSYLLSVELPPPPEVDIDFGPMRLAPGGLVVADFGEDPETTIEVLTFVLGDPDDDTGWIVGTDPDRPSCEGANRHVLWIIQGPADGGEDEEPGDPLAVLEVDFSDVTTGVREFAQYTYRTADPTAVDAGARRLATGEGVTIGSTLDQYVAAYGEPDWIEEDLGLASFGGAMTAGIELPPEDDAGRTDRRVLSIGAGADGCADTG